MKKTNSQKTRILIPVLIMIVIGVGAVLAFNTYNGYLAELIYQERLSQMTEVTQELYSSIDLLMGQEWETVQFITNWVICEQDRTIAELTGHLQMLQAIFEAGTNKLMPIVVDDNGRYYSASGQEGVIYKSTFLSNMSHDIRTPMNAIVGFSSLLSQDMDDPEKVREYTQKILASSQHLLGLINDVLDMSRIESGKTTLNLSVESISCIVDEIDTIIRPQMLAKGHIFEVDARQVVHDAIVVDKVRLNQICMNLLSNAVKYTPNRGHIRFRISERSVSGNMARYTIVVSDNGYGMSDSFREHIFDSFSREEDSRTSKIQGTGLGMAITKNLVDLMGGTIRVESKKSVGSTFIVDIPFQICQTPDAAAASKKVDADSDGGDQVSVLEGKHILIVEDNKLNAEILTALLEKSGASPKLCENGRDAVDVFTHSAPGAFDLILMDVQMPVMNGYEATGAIRRSSHPQARTIPIVAMTANAFTEDIQASLKAGMDAHVAKPVNMAVLEDTLRGILRPVSRN